MLTLIENVEFWKAFSAMLWPLVALVVFLSARGRIYAFLSRDNLSIKVAGMELSVADATKNIGTAVSDLQKRLGELESKFSGATTQVSQQPIGSPTSQAATAQEAGADKGEANSFSILWVDDYPSNNAFLVEQFQSEGIQVKLVLTTAMALKELENEEFQLIITDLGREEDGTNNPFAGLDLIRQIRARDENIPILVYAGQRGMQMKSRLVKAGANLVTHSPIDVQSFVTSVREKLR